MTGPREPSLIATAATSMNGAVTVRPTAASAASATRGRPLLLPAACCPLSRFTAPSRLPGSFRLLPAPRPSLPGPVPKAGSDRGGHQDVVAGRPQRTERDHAAEHGSAQDPELQAQGRQVDPA